jgi:hypothetical protein
MELSRASAHAIRNLKLCEREVSQAKGQIQILSPNLLVFNTIVVDGKQTSQGFDIAHRILIAHRSLTKRLHAWQQEGFHVINLGKEMLSIYIPDASPISRTLWSRTRPKSPALTLHCP